jgi:hypothetical protein
MTSGTAPMDQAPAMRKALAGDRRAAAKPEFKAWCARRWRSLFLDEAVRDADALDWATARGDRRSPRQRIAERYLLGDDCTAWRDEQPPWTPRPIARTTLLFCPGLLDGLLPVRGFDAVLPEVERRLGMRVVRSDSIPARSCEANVADIMRALNEGNGRDAAGKLIPQSQASPPGDVMMVGYSKGSPDMLTTLATHPGIAPRVRCAVTWAGATLGSELADETLATFGGKLSPDRAANLSQRLKGLVPSILKADERALHRVEEYDSAGAVRSLSTAERDAFMARNKDKLDGLSIPMFTVRGATRKSDIPYIQYQGFSQLSRFDPMNDMQVACNRSVLPFPMATELATVRANHWDLAYASFVKRRWLNAMYHPFPKLAAMMATVELMTELGLVD